ncbi:MAG: MopE-related protein, partial [Flavobacterium sp.]|nr:MopE-related protein [Flavobacterium sp.]
MNDNYHLLGARLLTWLKAQELPASGDSPDATKFKPRGSWVTSVLLLFVFIFSNSVSSQVSSYTFSQSSGTYSEITGGTTLVSCTECGIAYDTNSYVIALPTPFTFNFVSVSSVVMRVDGSLVVGSSTSSSSTSPISATTAATGVIAALGMDLRNCTIAGVQYELRWEDVGSEYVFQWKNASRWLQNTVERLNFQIRIVKSTGVISVVYGNFTDVANSLTYQPQVGLRGATNSDYNARRLTTTVPDATPTWDDTDVATSNAHTLRFTSGAPVSFPSLGYTYTWTPLVLVPCETPTALASNLTFSNVNTTLLNGSFTAAAPAPSKYLVVRSTSSTPPTPVNGTVYTVGGNLGAGTNVRSITNATTFSDNGLTPGEQYYYHVFSYNDLCTGQPFYSATALTAAQATVCAAGTSVASNSITTTSANITWSGSGTYIVEYGPTTGFTPGTGATAGTNGTIASSSATSPFSLSGLSPATSYRVHVRQVCPFGGYSANTSFITVTTLCVPELAPTVTQTFATFTGSAPNPVCWTEAKGAVAAPSTVVIQNGKWLSSSFGNTGSNTGAKVNLYDNNTGDWLISNQIDLGPITGLYRLKYRMAVTGYNLTTSQTTLGSHLVRVIVSTDGGVTWTSDDVIKTYTGVGAYSNTGQTEIVDLSDFKGLVKIAFVATTSSTTPDIDFHIDDFVIEAIPPCLEPSALSVSSVTATSASLSWAAPSSAPSAGYEWAVTTSTTPPASGTAVAGLTANAAGLSQNTTYYLHVRSNCDASGFSSWVTSLAFVTPCQTISALPYEMGFDGSALCWTASGGTNIWSLANGSSTDIPSPHEGSGFAVKPYSSSTQYLYSPPVNLASLGSSQAVLNFWFYRNVDGHINDAITFKLNTTAANAGATTIASYKVRASEVPVVESSGWYNYIVAIPTSWNSAGTFYVVIEGATSAGFSSYDIGLDSFRIDYAPVVVSSFTPSIVCGTAGGDLVTITGSNFTGATSVQFNGIEATSFTVLNATTIEAVVPAGDITGLITVYKEPSSNGFGSSLTNFEVKPFPTVAAITYEDEPVTTVTVCRPSQVDLGIATGGGSWSSSAPEIATVDGNGDVTSLQAGTVTISYTVVSEDGCSTTNSVSVTFNEPVNLTGFAPSQTVAIGTTAVFSVTTNTDPSYTYQWKSFDGLSEEDVVNGVGVYGETYQGATSSTLTILNTPGDLSGFEFYCEITPLAPCVVETSPNVTLNVGETGITSDPQSVSLCSSGSNSAQFIVGASGEVDDYVWQLDQTIEGFWETITDGSLYGLTFSNSTTNTLDVTGFTLANTGWRFRAIVNGPNNSPESNPAVVTVFESVTFSTNPQSALVCKIAGSTQFNVGYSGAATGVQWQYSADGVNYSNVTDALPAGVTYSGQTTTMLTVTRTASTPVGVYYYRALVAATSPCLAVSSEAATLEVTTPTVAVTPSSATYCSPGNPVVLTASGALNYSWSPMTGLTFEEGQTAVATASPLVTTTYEVTGTDANGCSSTTSVTVTVSVGISVSLASSSDAVCSGESVQMTLTNTTPLGNPKASGYLFESAAETYTQVVGTNSTAIGDDGSQNDIPLGFTFRFDDVDYTTFSINTNGFIRLGGSIALSSFTNILSNTTQYRPLIAPFWDDNHRNTGSISYTVSGSAPTRVLEVGWHNTNIGGIGATSPTLLASFKIRLFETTNVIEFVYGTMDAAGTLTASVGINGTDSFLSVTPAATPSASSTVANNIISSTVNLVGRRYRFTPDIPVYTYEWSSEPAGFSSSVANPIVQPTVNTTYSVVVSGPNGCSSTVSKTISISSGVTVTEQPQAVAPLCQGANTSFSVVATGPNLVYQWRKDGTNILGNASATTATLQLNGVTPAQSGSYDVLITPSCGDAQVSEAQLLTVYPTPTLAAISNQNYCSGELVGPQFLSGTPEGVTYDITGGSSVGLADAFGVSEIPSFATQIGSATVTVTPKANGCNGVARTFTITVGQSPTALTLNTNAEAICSTDPAVLLTASGGVGQAVFTKTVASGAVNLAIPDNSSTGVSQVLSVSGIPAGATISRVDVQFTLTHTFNGDVEVNLEAPNGKIVNLVADRGGSSDDFINTVVTSNTSAPAFSTGTGPFTGTFGADLTSQLTLIGPINTQVFSELFTVPNGDWIVKFYDDANGDTGNVLSVSISIVYSAVGDIAPTWLPISGLYLDAAATQPYSGGTAASVYARPSSTQSYTATASSSNGCAATDTVTIDVTAATAWYLDADADGYYTGSAVFSCVSPGSGYVTTVIGGNDCNDSNAAVNPGATEVCFDGIDNNCDGSLYDGCTPVITTMEAVHQNQVLPNFRTTLRAIVPS